MMSPTIYEKLKFIKFFMKKRYKQKELWFRIKANIFWWIKYHVVTRNADLGQK